MPELNTVIDILKLIDKSNCRQCGSLTCLAFSAAVINGQKQLKDCPKLDEETLARYDGKVEAQESVEQKAMEAIEQLKREIAGIDLEAAANRLGAQFSNGRITIHCLGKKFSLDSNGDIITDIHVNQWIAGPVFKYILHGAGVPLSGKWVPLRDLEGGKDWQHLFRQRCEKPCKEVADTNPDFFNDLVHLFNGKQGENHYKSDVSVVLHPLPKVPILFCYWKRDGDLPSDLNIFFDSTAEENLNIELIYALATGLVMMFEKIARKHAHELE
jgi:hypothetical protein